MVNLAGRTVSCRYPAENGFVFAHPRWPEAAEDLVCRVRTRAGPSGGSPTPDQR